MSDNNEGFFTCKNMCWMAGALLGIAVFLILSGNTGMGTILAIGIALVVTVAIAVILRSLLCGEVENTRESATAAPAAASAPAAEVNKSDVSGADGGSKSEESGKESSTKTSEAAPAAEEVAAEEEAGEAKPVTLTAARDSGADDLKLLKGVGPKLEQTLNELGFYHFDQVADWGAAEIEWVDSRLKFKGRIERDGWVAQAKILAEGGTTEFSKKAKKGK